jgi:hypothetical protein
MPNDNLLFPKRFIGYGAYNLCFDTTLAESVDPLDNVRRNFFRYIRKRPALNPINLVRVICFRNSQQEGLPAVVYNADGSVTAASRTQPLFRKGEDPTTKSEVNPRFLDNLLALVQEAKQNGFWVQVCLFHEHAVKQDSNGNFENPENMPAVLDTRALPDNCARLSTFFNIGTTPQAQARLTRQQRLVYQIASKLRWETNILWELANEVRIDGCTDASRNCAIVPWLEAMADQVLSGIFWDHDPSGTSTGANNEHQLFDPARPAACAAVPQPWRPVYYDFHTVQWGIPIDDINSQGYIAGIPNAKGRVAAYKPNTPPFLIINDDGAKFGDELTAAEKQAHAALILKWATRAFEHGLHYSSKQQYPPVAWDMPALNALVQANSAFPPPA